MFGHGDVFMAQHNLIGRHEISRWRHNWDCTIWAKWEMVASKQACVGAIGFGFFQAVSCAECFGRPAVPRSHTRFSFKPVQLKSSFSPLCHVFEKSVCA
jgi:hypothetical protein